MPEEIQYSQQNGQLKASPRELVVKYSHYLPWVIVSVALMLLLAFINLRYSTVIYNVSGKLLVVRNSGGAGGRDKFDDILSMQGASNNLNDEMEIIKSRSMAARVVKALELQTRFYNKGKINTQAVHPDDYPFKLEIKSITDTLKGFGFKFTVDNPNQFRIDKNSKANFFGEWIILPDVTFRLINPAHTMPLSTNNEFIISWIPLQQASADLSSGIKVAPVGELSNVLGLSYETENPKIGLEIVNKFMEEYREASLEDKKQQAINTVEFIDKQLDTVKRELGGVEGDLLNTKQKYQIYSPGAQSSMVFGELAAANSKLTEQAVKLKLVDILTNYVNDKSNSYRMVPSTMGIEEPTLLQQVTDYNKLQLERETALKTTTASNPLIINFDVALERLRNDMLQNLQHVRQTYTVSINEIQHKFSEANSQIGSIPVKEKVLLDATRQQAILQELYSFLLRKKLETAITSASNISNIKVLEPAMSSGAPVSPNRKGLYTAALLVGLGIPALIIFLIEYLNDKVKDKHDIERLTATPVLGEIGHAEESAALVVIKNSRHFIAEQFRIVRSNLQYILPKLEKPIIMVTSSFSGEGKSFISTNLGAVLALSGKRTVILEFDIRKPKILQGLGLTERLGITNYIVGNIQVKDIIYPVPNVENLFVVPCGPVPPNPAEILLDEKVNILFKELGEQFDTIIIDTAPVGLVSDAITLGKHANACVYIVRHNYTFKKQMQLIDDLYTQKKLPHLSIIINDIKATAGSYGYGYGGYGYGGYGYGYGAGYFEEGGVKKKGFWRKIKNRFS